MGTFAGVLSGIGGEVQRENIQKLAFEHEAHNEMASQFEEMAKTANPDFAPDLLKAAFAIRTTPPGKKPPTWATDLKAIMVRRIEENVKSGKSQVQLPQPQTPGQPPQSQSSAPNQQQAPSLPAPPTGGGSGTDIQTPQQTQNNSAPPPVSGIPSPGFNSLAPPPASVQMPSVPGAFTTSEGQFQNYKPSPADTANLEIQKKSVEDEQQQQAEMRRMLGVNAANVAANRAEIDQRIKDLQSVKDPETGRSSWDSLSARQKAEIRIGAKQITPERAPVNVPGLVRTDTILASDPGALDGFGQPLKKGEQVRVRISPDGQREFFPETGATTTRLVTHLDGKSYLETIDRSGQVVESREVVNPATLPTTTSESGTKITMVPQPDGTIKPVPVTGTSQTIRTKGNGITVPPTSSTPSTPSLPTPPRSSASVGTPGTAVGGRSIPPEDIIKLKQSAGQLDNAILLANRVQSRLPLLNRLIDAKKISMQIDPAQGIFKSFVNRNVKLTDEEASLAADFATLTEDINLLRGPLGATGFRGEEAFAALQQQRGNLLANPRVTKGILDNTLRALRTQRNAIPKEVAGDSGLPAPPSGRSYTKFGMGPDNHRIGMGTDGHWYDVVSGIQITGAK